MERLLAALALVCAPAAAQAETAATSLTSFAAPVTDHPLGSRPGAPGGHGPVRVLVIVSSHGLNLSSSAGADSFVRRLQVAVDQSCNDLPASPVRSLARSAQFRDCRRKVLETAMTYVSSPLVRQRYAHLRTAEGVSLARR